MEPRLEELKTRFTSIMMGVDEDIIPDFMWWIDHKVAEFKVYGQMIFKDSGHLTPNCSPYWPSGNHIRTPSSHSLQQLLRNNRTSLIPLQNVQRFVSSSTKRKQNTPCRRIPTNNLPDISTIGEDSPRRKRIKYTRREVCNKEINSPVEKDIEFVSTSSPSIHNFHPHGNRLLNDLIENHNALDRPLDFSIKTETSLQLLTPKKEPGLDETSPNNDWVFPSEKVVMKSSGRGRKIPFDTSGDIDAEGNGIGFKCEICGAILQYKSGLNRHLLRHTSCKDYQCSLCDKLFHRKDNLVIHIRKVHCKTTLQPTQESKPVINTEEAVAEDINTQQNFSYPETSQYQESTENCNQDNVIVQQINDQSLSEAFVQLSQNISAHENEDVVMTHGSGTENAVIAKQEICDNLTLDFESGLSPSVERGLDSFIDKDCDGMSQSSSCQTSYPVSVQTEQQEPYDIDLSELAVKQEPPDSVDEDTNA